MELIEILLIINVSDLVFVNNLIKLLFYESWGKYWIQHLMRWQCEIFLFC